MRTGRTDGPGRRVDSCLAFTEPAKVSEISGPGPSTREEIRMLNRWVRTATSTVERGGHRVGQTIKTLLRPGRTTAALTSAGALDAVRPRSELVAENAP